jgi:hypothetical protein
MGGGICLRIVARVRIRHRADQRGASACRPAHCAPFLQRRLEIGQLGFVALILAMARASRVLEIDWPRWLQALPGYAVGTLGAFWTLQRVALLVGALR